MATLAPAVHAGAGPGGRGQMPGQDGEGEALHPVKQTTRSAPPIDFN